MKGAGHEPSPTPSSQALFQRLERLESDASLSGHTGHNRWMIPYADLLTLLLGLFLVIFTAGKAETQANPSPAAKHSQTVAQAKAATEKQADQQMAAEMQKKLQQELKLQGVEIRQQERGLVISLKDSILFAPGNADLSPQARHTLDRLAGELGAVMGQADRPIRVEGHTDNTPIQTSKFPSNWELSTARATNIVRYLIASHHFSPDKLSAAGYGEFKPVDDNSTIEGKQKNRRVDIVVLNTDTAKQEPPVLTPNSSGSTNEQPEAGTLDRRER